MVINAIATNTTDCPVIYSCTCCLPTPIVIFTGIPLCTGSKISIPFGYPTIITTVLPVPVEGKKNRNQMGSLHVYFPHEIQLHCTEY